MSEKATLEAAAYSDPEVQAMAYVVEALLPLDDAARSRVLDWVRARYVITKAVQDMHPSDPRRVSVVPLNKSGS